MDGQWGPLQAFGAGLVRSPGKRCEKSGFAILEGHLRKKIHQIFRRAGLGSEGGHFENINSGVVGLRCE